MKRLLASVLLCFAISALAADPPKDAPAATVPQPTTPDRPAPEPSPSQLPNNGILAIVIGPDGKTTVVNRQLKEVPPCQLCSKALAAKFGKKCERAPDSVRICPGTRGTTIRWVLPASIMTHTGSCCSTTGIDGRMYGECCDPSSDPFCACSK